VLLLLLQLVKYVGTGVGQLPAACETSEGFSNVAFMKQITV
jgi:hypothetical protein